VEVPTVSRKALLSSVLATGVLAAFAVAAELQPRTIAAFDRYIRATEAQMVAEPFLRIDALPDDPRRQALAEVRRGQLYIERMSTREGDGEIDVPGGMIHHWLGTVFVPGAAVDEAVALLQDYDRHADVYSPAIQRSKLVSRDGDVFQVYLRFYMKKVITVVVDTQHEARFTRPAPDRVHSRIYSLRIAQVEHPGTNRERELPVGDDGGYLWRLYTYWRFLERDGGTYVQCEAISLTRGIPRLLGWLVGPFVTSIPRESLAFTLETTRDTLGRAERTGAGPSPSTPSRQ
jgi:hypothetical protein